MRVAASCRGVKVQIREQDPRRRPLILRPKTLYLFCRGNFTGRVQKKDVKFSHLAEAFSDVLWLKRTVPKRRKRPK